MKTISRVAIACAVALSTSQAFAAGFQLNGTSTSGIGRAMAGDAVIADNAAVLARNPAAMAMFDAPAMSVGVTYADVQVDVKDATFNTLNPVTGDPLSLELGTINDAADAKVIPNAFYIHPINDKFAVGTGVFSNYGTGTDTTSLLNNSPLAPYDLIGKTEVTTINWNISGSYRINDQLSIGAGVDVIYGEGLLSRTVPGETPLDLVDVDASGIAFGGIVGATYEFNDDHRIGFSYRFSPDVKADGTVNVFVADLGQSVAFDEVTVPLADVAQIAGYHRLTDKFAAHYTVQWTQWSNFETIDLSGSPEPLKSYYWDDSLFTSIGGTWYYNDFLTLRAGFALDQGVVPSNSQYESISIPDSDRQWYSVGATFKVSQKGTIDLAFAHIAGDKVEVTESSEFGSMTAHTQSNANYFSVQYNRQF